MYLAGGLQGEKKTKEKTILGLIEDFHNLFFSVLAFLLCWVICWLLINGKVCLFETIVSAKWNDCFARTCFTWCTFF